mmetsp:Transcript_5970/g.24661  ORF Transcript_5970/g.24661 Transcript_5970/m.24661 type:complete len:260 (-) Transcript_5970:316-1095(-)
MCIPTLNTKTVCSQVQPRLLEELVHLRKRQRRCGVALQLFPVGGHLVRLRVHRDDGKRVVVTHVQLGQTSALLDGHDPLGQSVGLGDALVDARLRHEGDARSARLVCRPHGTHDDGLRGGNGRVGVAHLSPRDLTALDDNLGLGPEKRRFPEAQVRELADFHAADDVRHPVRHRGVDGVLCDVSLDAEVIRGAVLFEDAALRLHLGGGLPRAGDHFADSAHGLRVRRHDADGAHVVEDILRGDGLGADSRLGEGDVFRD